MNFEKHESTLSTNDELSQDIEVIENSFDYEPTMQDSYKEELHGFHIKLSKSLFNALCAKSKEEGVSAQEFALELISEGLTLRAWEIMERKQAMKHGKPGPNNGGTASYTNNNRQNGKGGFRQGNNNFSRGRNGYNKFSNNPSNHGGRQNNFKNIIDDNASFIDYVRKQEKKNR